MWLYLPISSQFLCEQGSEEHCSAAIRRHSDVSVIAGGMIGFSRAGRLSVLLERWHPSGGGGLYEWLRKARVCTLLVGTESVTRSRSDIVLLWQNDGLSILREQTLALYGALHAVNDTEHHHIMIISPSQTFNFGLNLANCIHKSKKKEKV